LSDIARWRRPSPEPHWPLAGIGHNRGPSLEDEPPGKLLLGRHHWKRAWAAARTTPSHDILRFRLRRAAAAGVSYEEYLVELLDTGRHLQREDVEKRKAATEPRPLDRRRPRRA
jgi:hypothetical protein